MSRVAWALDAPAWHWSCEKAARGGRWRSAMAAIDDPKGHAAGLVWQLLAVAIRAVLRVERPLAQEMEGLDESFTMVPW